MKWNLADLTGQNRTADEILDQIKNQPLTDRTEGVADSKVEADPMQSYAKDYVDQKLETERARTDTRFAELSGKIDTMSAMIEGRLRGIPSRWEMWLGLLGVVVAVVGMVFTGLSYSGGRFDAGIGLADQRQEQLQRDEAQDERLDQILRAIEGLEVPPGTQETE